ISLEIDLSTMHGTQSPPGAILSDPEMHDVFSRLVRSTAISVRAPVIVPSSISGGRSGSLGRGEGKAAATTGGAASGGSGAWREGENNGRSTVVRRCASGTPHKGFPVFGPVPSLA